MPPTPLERLLSAISTQDIREQVSTLIELGTEAVDALSQLDEKIYKHHEAVTRDSKNGSEVGSVLKRLADEILGGVRALEQHLREKATTSSSGTDDATREVELEFDLEQGAGADTSRADAAAPPALANDDRAAALSFGERHPEEFAADEGGFDLGDLNFNDTLDILGSDEPEIDCEERWALLCAELVSFSYGMGSQLRDFDKRFSKALKSARYDHALRELNDVGNSVTDGVFALMIEIYGAYLDNVDRDSLLPGHKSTLSRALLVRKGLGGLRSAVHGSNKILQDETHTAREQEKAFLDITSELGRFVDGEVFRVMRAADRVEINKFLATLSAKDFRGARLDCEGLDKYLESLAIVSNRDVLIAHDTKRVKDIRGLLEAVKPLLSISPRGALDMIAEAFAIATSLYGVRTPLDELLARWEALDRKLRQYPSEAVAMSQNLAKTIVGL